MGLCISAVSFSCSSKPIDPRTVIPADALVYLETSDLGKTIGAMTESRAFARISKTKPDLTMLTGLKMSIAVTGFETSEEAVTAENSVLNFQPRFVAVVETNAWSWQAASFAENKLGEFINEIYGGGVELSIVPKDGGKYFVWTAQDGRKAFALVQGSLIYFGNDESAIEKCQAVKRGEMDSIAGNRKIDDGQRLAFGYVSSEGVAQIANIAGISLAMQSSEEGEVKSFVARILPEMFRSSIKELRWTAVKTEQGIEDKYDVTLSPEVTRVFAGTLSKGESLPSGLEKFIPAEFDSATLYNLKDPRLAWQSIVLAARSQTDAVSGGLIASFSGSLFEPFAIEDPELFLGSVDGQIVTVSLDPEGENTVVIAKAKNVSDVKRSAKEFSFANPPEKAGAADVWKSAEGEMAAAILGEVVILGDAESVMKCLAAGQNSADGAGRFERFNAKTAVSLTISNDVDTPSKLAAALGEKTADNAASNQVSFIATSFDSKGMQRTAASDFGLIGALIVQVAGTQAASRQ